MKRLIRLVPAAMLLMGAAFLIAAEGTGKFMVWTASDLKARGVALASKLGADKSASDKLGDYGNYNMQLAHREGPGGGELHEKFTDIFVIQSGEATVVIGGKVDGAHEASPGEIRGTGVTGGERRHVSAGDVVHIPANTPHQMLVDPGKHVTYFVVKVSV